MTLIRPMQSIFASFTFSSLFLLFFFLVDYSSGTLYRIGNDVTITCSKQYKGEFSYDPTLDVKLASSGGTGKKGRERRGRRERERERDREREREKESKISTCSL